MRSVRPLIPLLALSLSLALAGCKQDKDTDDTDADTETDTDASPIEPISIVATVDDVEVTSVPERTSNVRLTARWSGEPTTWRWSQRSGPPVSVSEHGYDSVSLDLSGFEVAAPVELVFEVSDALRRAAPVPFTLVVTPVDLERAMGPDVQVGGASSVVTTFEHAEARWMVYSAGNRLSVSPVQTSPGAEVRLHLEDYIYDVVVVERDGQRFALVALGASGLGVVDLTDPMTPTVLDTVTVDYFQDGLSFAEGGGDILVDQEISSERGPITCLETDGTTLWLGDAGYGLHRTALDNVIGPAGVVREADGTLLIDAEAFVLQYAGENPWGAPEDMKLVDGRLFVAQGFLGLGIYDPITFERVGGYNLYSDASVVEDWFIDMDVAAEVHRDPTTDEPYLDAVTGLPDYRQANFEVEQVWHGEVDAPTPWAEFDRYARYYYVARAVDVATHGPTDIAYVAYGLGGLVAVDVSGFRTATSAAPVSPTYLGSLPAAPAHGPEKPTGGGSTESLYPHYGSGKLVEAGMVDVAVDGDVVWASDHFAGLIAIEGASDPGGRWHGQNGVGAYDNDDPSLGDGILGDHWPDTEFVTSFDMAPWDPTDHESLPAWMYESPALLVSGEVIGHGGPLVVVPGSDVHAPGGVDIIQAAGSGGMMTLDIVDIAAPVNGDRFSLLGWYATTDELGAAPDGSITEPISVGHTQGVTASSQYLYVGDGPHGGDGLADRGGGRDPDRRAAPGRQHGPGRVPGDRRERHRLPRDPRVERGVPAGERGRAVHVPDRRSTARPSRRRGGGPRDARRPAAAPAAADRPVRAQRRRGQRGRPARPGSRLRRDRRR